MKPLKIIFMGTPEMAVPSLKTLLASDHRVVGVVSQPDKPVGRSQELISPPVAHLAKEHGLPLFQPERIKGNVEFLKNLQDLNPDLIVVVAYGKILPPEVLNLPPYKCINLHFSLLPQYRGAAPVQWALINGEEETGVTTFILADKVDAGPILMQKKALIEPEDNAETLGRRLSHMGAQVLVETVDEISSGDLKAIPQEDRSATFAPPLKKEDGRLDWSQKASVLVFQIRGMNPWPGTFTTLDKKLFKIHRAQTASEKKLPQSPGEVVGIHSEGLEIACGRGSLLLAEVQLEGKKRMNTTAFLAGYPLRTGQKLGE